MKVSKQTALLAKKYKCNPRTIMRWQQQEAPLHDAKQMSAWLAGRKNLPAGTAALASKASAARLASAITDNAAGDTTGAPAALHRLEAVEAKSFKILSRALKSGNPLEVRNARELWLKVGDSLRRYDLLVDRSRRDSGELVPRGEVERHLQNLVRWWKLAIVQSANTVAGAGQRLMAADLCDLIRGTMLDNVLSSLAIMAAKPTPSQVPPWFVQAAVAPMRQSVTEADELVVARQKAVEEIFQVLVEANTEQRAAHLAKLREGA
jgi:hypothetical protein